jgi:hypothetical protein
MKEEKLACVLDRHSQSHSHGRTTHPAIENDRENPAARDFRAIHAYVYTQIHLVACSALARHGALATATTPPLAGRDTCRRSTYVCVRGKGRDRATCRPALLFTIAGTCVSKFALTLKRSIVFYFFVQTENAVGER